MKISFITTVFNEEKTIDKFFVSLLSQTKLPYEIVVVDGKSTDQTRDKIKNYELKIKKEKVNFKLLIKSGNRSVGRNEAIKHATGDIIVCSDAGNILDKDWIKNITEPFKNSTVDVVAGYYQGLAKNVFQKCLIPYVLVMPDKIDSHNFLPATRSVAFRKSIWEEVDGFDERLSHNEDYAFAKKLEKGKARIVFKEDAIVHWIPRNNLKEAFIMFFRFAYGDAEAGIFRPKVLFIFVRYIVGIFLLFSAIMLNLSFLSISFIILLLLYLVWAVSKNYKYVKAWQAFYLLPLMQFIADFAVLLGVTLGLMNMI